MRQLGVQINGLTQIFDVEVVVHFHVFFLHPIFAVTFVMFFSYFFSVFR